MTGSRRAISSTMSGEPSVEASSTTMISLETGTARTRLSSSATVERSLWQGTMTERTGGIRDILSSRARAAPEPRPSPCPPEPAPASEPGAGECMLRSAARPGRGSGRGRGHGKGVLDCCDPCYDELCRFFPREFRAYALRRPLSLGARFVLMFVHVPHQLA